MQQIFYLSFEYLFLNIIFLSSCLGYGRLITNNIIKFNYETNNKELVYKIQKFNNTDKIINSFFITIYPSTILWNVDI